MPATEPAHWSQPLRRLLLLPLLSASALSPMPAAAAELLLERTAVDKMLAQTLFKEEGRHFLLKTACEAYLDQPATTLKDGRIVIRFHLTAKVGVPVGKVCMGPTLTTWSVASGKPVPDGGVVRLQDIRVEEIEDPKIRFLLKTGLAPAIPQALELDIRKAVGSMMKASSTQLVANVDMVQITSVVAENDLLSVKFDFKLVAK